MRSAPVAICRRCSRSAAPTREHADMLERRLAMIREDLVPDCRCDPAVNALA